MMTGIINMRQRDLSAATSQAQRLNHPLYHLIRTLDHRSTYVIRRWGLRGDQLIDDHDIDQSVDKKILTQNPKFNKKKAGSK